VVGAVAGPHWVPGPTLTHPDQLTGVGFGTVLSLGDINNDGALDLLVGVPEATVADQERAGEALVYFGPDFAAMRRLADPQPIAHAHFGAALAVADLDDDGHADLVVGAPGVSPIRFSDPTRPGQVRIFAGPDFGGVQTLEPQPGPKAPGFGGALAIGDVTGDGVLDLAVGDTGLYFFRGEARLEDPAKEGVHVFAGPSWELRQDLGRRPFNGFYSDLFGAAVAVGDVDGDGIGDLVIGAPFRSDAPGDSGAVVVFRGPDLARGGRVEALPGAYDYLSEFGRALAVADFDGDGAVELVVGDPISRIMTSSPNSVRSRLPADARTAGVVAVVAGLASPGEPTRQELRPVADTTDLGFGTAVAVGDVDGDGVPDIIAGGHAPADHLAVFLGPTFVAQPVLEGVTGTVVAVGDLNRDGRADLVALAPEEQVRVFLSVRDGPP
jgi:hypothetical protein